MTGKELGHLDNTVALLRSDQSTQKIASTAHVQMLSWHRGKTPGPSGHADLHNHKYSVLGKQAQNMPIAKCTATAMVTND